MKNDTNEQNRREPLDPENKVDRSEKRTSPIQLKAARNSHTAPPLDPRSLNLPSGGVAFDRKIPPSRCAASPVRSRVRRIAVAFSTVETRTGQRKRSTAKRAGIGPAIGVAFRAAARSRLPLRPRNSRGARARARRQFPFTFRQCYSRHRRSLILHRARRRRRDPRASNRRSRDFHVARGPQTRRSASCSPGTDSVRGPIRPAGRPAGIEDKMSRLLLLAVLLVGAMEAVPGRLNGTCPSRTDIPERRSSS